MAQRQLAFILTGHEQDIYSLAFVPKSDSTFLSGSGDHTVRLWDAQKSTQTLKLETEDSVAAVAASPDGKSIAAGGLDSRIRLWDIEGNLKAIYEGHMDSIYNVCFAPNSMSLLSGSLDNTCRVWKLEKAGNPYKSFVGHKVSYDGIM